MISLEAALLLTAATVALASGLAAAEMFAARTVLEDGHLLSWRVARFTTKWRLSGLRGLVLDATMPWPRYGWVIASRLVAALLVIVLAATGQLSALAMAVLAVTALAVSIRSPFGLDGAHQMTTLIAVSMTLGLTAATLGGDRALSLVMWFVALQLFLSYAIAGIAKLVSPTWREGSALPGLLSTHTYGHRKLAILLTRHPGLARAASRTVIVMELALPLALVAPDPIAVALLTCGLFFHVSTAVFMGLNNFLVAFLAAYPAALLVTTT